jgi:hypothetical protein
MIAFLCIIESSVSPAWQPAQEDAESKPSEIESRIEKC